GGARRREGTGVCPRHGLAGPGRRAAARSCPGQRPALEPEGAFVIRRPHPSLLDLYDALLLDLDGTLMHGTVPIPHAAGAVERARAAGVRLVFATNNASRTPQQAAEHLALVGVDAEPAEFVTSPQVASRLLAERLGPGAKVLVVGGPSLAEQIRLEGLEATFEDEREVAAVVQGWSPDLNWERLADGSYAIRRGAYWMATNVDATLPTERGMAPGNGSMVAALRHAPGVEPALAGQPVPGVLSSPAHGARYGPGQRLHGRRAAPRDRRRAGCGGQARAGDVHRRRPGHRSPAPADRGRPARHRHRGSGACRHGLAAGADRCEHRRGR